MNIFEKIYDKNKWNFGSGEGSLERYTRGYRNFLERFLREHRIASVLDFGCGDWQSSQYVEWGGVRYHGVDIVPAVIERNQKEYQNASIRFSLIDEADELEAADLFIAKDVFQHWSNDKIRRFLPRLKQYKYALITNCGDLPHCRYTDITDGGFRTLDLSRSPFNVVGRHIFSFCTRPISFRTVVKWLLPHQFKGQDYNNKKVFFIDNTKI